MAAPSQFSAHNPKLQVAWDSTSLKALQFCPRRYQYEILEGYRGSGIDLEFGILAHSAVELYYRERLAGKNREDAQLAAVRWALEESGKHEEDGTWAPWGGRYETQWRCKGETTYKNAKGNRAKCPWSHKGVWHSTEQPGVCGECGSDTESARRWLPFDAKKDRHALVRLVVWYIEEQPEALEDGIRPLNLKDGTPAVELPFRVPLPFKVKRKTATAIQTASGHAQTVEREIEEEPYLLCGYFDRLGAFGSEHLTVDLKTTGGNSLGRYLKSFSPNTQVDVYDLAGSLLFPELELKGILIDGVQLMAGGCRFGKAVIYHTEEQRQELLDEIEFWVRQAERYAEADHWPMNRANCWHCPWAGVCSLPPGIRAEHLKANFKVNKWNPLEER